MCLVMKISAKTENFDTVHTAFGVSKICNNENLVDKFCSHLIKKEGDNIKKVPEDEEEEWKADHQEAQGSTEVPIEVPIKRKLLDEFSSTQILKKSKIEKIDEEKN